ncbi:hypothetical protein NQ318_023397 [Aromia moschata]|uniref:Uncharacterized protein n=1 Tax=Aromia moschata TaxID=1265417 RepID=A0AAV8YUR4_9CUCU|nr:hypothetical protein NQ318_023397 [Aromia moschata]
MSKVCEREIRCWDEYDCKKQVNSAQHIWKKTDVPLKTQFMFNLLLMVPGINAVPDAVTKQQNITVLHKYTPTGRKYVINKIKCVLKNARLRLCVDETILIVNIIVPVLDPLKPTCPLLLTSKKLSVLARNTYAGGARYITKI